MGIYTAAVQKLYVAYFNRPADFLGLQYWEGVVAANNGDTTLISAAFSVSPEYVAAYAGMNNAEIVNQVYMNLFGRGATDVAGLNFWANHLNNGTLTVSNVVTAIAQGAQGSDLVAYNNKVSAATAFTGALDTSAEVLGYSGDAANLAAKAWMSSITNNASLITATAPTALNMAVADVIAAGAVIPGRIIAMTQDSDVLTGGEGDDLFVGRAGLDEDNTNPSVAGDDVLNGAGGYNTLRVSLYQSDDDPGLMPQTTNIQRLEVIVNDNDDWSVAGMDGLEIIALKDTLVAYNSNYAEFEGFSTLVDAELNNTNMELEFRYGAGLASGDADETTLTLSRARSEDFYGSYGAEFQVYLFGAGEAIETLNVVSTGSIANFVTISGDAAYETLNFSGAQDLLVEGFDAPETVRTITTSGAAVDLIDSELDFSGLEVINAADSTGGLSVLSSSSHLESVAGGVGDDNFELTGSVVLGEIHMGEGDNVLVVENVDIDEDADILGLSVTAGSGDDFIEISRMDPAEGFVSINAGAGDNDVYADADGNVSVTTLGGDDNIEVYSLSDISVNAGNGDNVVAAYGEGDLVAVTTGAGDDDITVEAAGDATINAGAGANEVFVEAFGDIGVTTLEGDDSITAIALAAIDSEDGATGDITINAGNGNNDVMAYTAFDGEGLDDLGGGDVSVIAGSGDDRIIAGTSGGDVVVSAGNGDNYVLAATDDGTVNVTTGTGADHVDVTFASLTAQGSAVALGSGFNTLGILDGSANELGDAVGYGEDSAEALDEAWLNDFDALALPVTGTVNRLELLNDFEIGGSVTLDVSGFAGSVSELYFGEIDGDAEDDSQHDFTIAGMAGDVLIQSRVDFEMLAGDDAENAGRLTVEGATSITIEAGVAHSAGGEDAFDIASQRAGVWNDGVFTVTDGFNGEDGDVEFNLGTGNAVLTSLNVAADDGALVHISDNNGSVAFDIGSVNIYSELGDSELEMDDNAGTTINIDAVNIISANDADVSMHDSTDSVYTLGAVTMVAGDDATFHFDESDEGHSGSSLSVESLTMTSDDWSEIQINTTTDAIVSIGSIVVNAGGYIDVNLGASGDFNVDASITLGAVTLNADEYIELSAESNVTSVVSIGDVNATGSSYVYGEFDDNVNTDITIASATMTSTDEDVYFSFYQNELSDDETVVDDMLLTVTGDITLVGSTDALFEVSDNADNSVERNLVVDVKGAVSVSSEGDSSVYVSDNDGSTVHIRGAVEINSLSEFDGSADLTVTYNDGSAIRFHDTVTLTASGEDASAFVYIEDHEDDAIVSFDKLVKITAGEDAEFSIYYNYYSDVTLAEGVEIQAGGATTIGVDYNVSSSVTVNGMNVTSEYGVDVDIDGNDSAAVSLGDIELSSDSGDVVVTIDDNDSSSITLGDVTLDGESAEFSIYNSGSGNDDTGITVGNLSITATWGDAEANIYGSDFGSIEMGAISMRASVDAYLTLDEYDSSDLSAGDIYVRAGVEWDPVNEVWDDSLEFDADVDLDVEGVSGTETIYLQTNQTEDSAIDAYIIDTPDLHTITMAGGGVDEMSELEVYGTQGNLDGVFTIDMSGLTSDVAVRTVSNNLILQSRDSVEDSADFDDGVVVQVFIGSGATQYNVEFFAEASIFSNLNGLPASSEGWVSTGVRDLSTVAKVMTFTPGNTGVGDGEDDYGYYNLTIQLNDTLHPFSVLHADTDGSTEWDFTAESDLPAGYALSIDEDSGVLTLTGPTDGTDYAASISTASLSEGDGALLSFNYGMATTTAADPIEDGTGLLNREVFTFTGDDIGDVVIGGFNPGVWNIVSPLNGFVTDRLDFSQFSAVTSLDDLIFTIDETGPVDNVVIDFADSDLGSITLVGVGEYDNAITLVQGSIMFG